MGCQGNGSCYLEPEEHCIHIIAELQYSSRVQKMLSLLFSRHLHAFGAPDHIHTSGCIPGFISLSQRHTEHASEISYA